VLAGVSLAAGLLDAATSAIRWVRVGQMLTATEIALSAVFVLALLIAPTIAWVRFVAERVWPNTPRTIEVAARLSQMLVTGLVAYGALALGRRVLHGVAQDTPDVIAEARSAIFMFAASAAAAATAWALERVRRRG
jgi:hypothetical protein